MSERMLSRFLFLSTCGLAAVAIGCGGGSSPPAMSDAGQDASVLPDAQIGGGDAGPDAAVDAGQPDAGQPDAGQPDAGQPDASTGCPGNCDDGVACTVDTCNQGTGTCTNTPNDAACDDSNDCTADTCDMTNGCQHTNVANDTSCNGGAGTCQNGSCVGITCGNGIVEPGEQCDDGNTTNCDGCSSTCQTETACNDGVACTTDSCNPSTGACVYTPNNAACNDSNACTTDTCTATGCQHGNVANGTSCNGGAGTCQGGTCTAIVCGNGIVEPGEQCDDGNTTNCDGCSSTCQTETACNDGVACTTDTCNPSTGACVYTPNNAACDDGNECTTDTCTGSGCQHANVADGTTCSTGTCQSGVCTAAANKVVFRVNSISLVDPHIILDTSYLIFSICGDITNNDLAVAGGIVTIPALNPALMNSVTMDTDSNGLLDLSYALEIDNLQQTDNFVSPGYVVRSDCTTETNCMPTAGATPTSANVTIHTTGGACLAPQGLQTGMWPDTHVSANDVNSPVTGSYGCFVSDKAMFTLTATLQGATINIPLQDAQIAGTANADPATSITNGLIIGFLPETVADGIAINVTNPVTLNLSLGQDVLPDNGSNCPGDTRSQCTGPDGRDVYNGTCGWWFTINFTADVITNATGY